MNMQVFYRHLTTQATETYHHQMVLLTRVSRAQVLKATQEGTWLWWDVETTPNA